MLRRKTGANNTFLNLFMSPCMPQAFQIHVLRLVNLGMSSMICQFHESVNMCAFLHGSDDGLLMISVARTV